MQRKKKHLHAHVMSNHRLTPALGGAGTICQPKIMPLMVEMQTNCISGRFLRSYRIVFYVAINVFRLVMASAGSIFDKERRQTISREASTQ